MGGEGRTINFGVRCVYLAQRFKACHLMTDNESVKQSWIFEGSDTDRGLFGYMGHFDELAELVACIRHGGQPTMTVRDAAYVLAVEKAILESIESGKVVDFAGFLEEREVGFLREKR
jgi:predicted dehydrogenase